MNGLEDLIEIGKITAIGAPLVLGVLHGAVALNKRRKHVKQLMPLYHQGEIPEKPTIYNIAKIDPTYKPIENFYDFN